MKYYFNKFIEYLVDNNIEITPYCFLILKKIKELIESGEIEKWQWKMSKKLKEYFFDEFNISEFSEENINVDLTLLKFEDIENSENGYPIERINTVQIKNFRWFWEYWEEDEWCCFDFSDKNKIILYWPNWTWKSCFAEALEYSLTWDIKECIRKWKDIDKYIKHKSKSPDIFINGEKMNLLLWEKEELKKCFIEKNRITEFSLFKSKDTWVKNYREVLTILLWLWELNDFIWSFVQNDSFLLSNEKAVEKAEKDIEFAEKDIKDKKAIFMDKKNSLEKLKERLISLWLLDNDTLEKNETVISWLKTQIEFCEKQLELPKILGSLNDIRQKEIIGLEDELKNKNKELGEVKKELDEKKTDVNMKNLYEAIRALPNENRDVCPACHTSKENWKENPFDNANKELKNMEKIIELEKKYESLKILVEKELPYKIKEKDGELDSNILKLKIFDENINKDNYFKKLKILKEGIDEKKIEEIKANKQAKQSELSNIEYCLKQYDEFTEEISKWEPNIEPEKAEEMKLKLDKEKNKDIILKNINDGYWKFRDNIDIFYNNFIKQETENLRNDVWEYYKKINKHDDESEQIQYISTKEWYDDFEILLHFTDWREEDAVNYLSEWHLKALWLSILWADMKKNNVPIMVFDDVVNAIDTEHRSNIIEILHTDEFLSNRQLILTVHDRLFWEKYCNNFWVDNNSWVSIILKHNNTFGISYEIYDEINYQEKIEFSIEKYDLRQAIIFSRIWFETVIYTYLRKNKIKVDWFFKKDGKNLVLMTDIQTLFTKFDSEIRHEEWYDEISESYNILRKTSINWNIINQEAHASDEQTYNIIESTTSTDVSIIYNALLDVIPFIQKMINRSCDQQ